VVRRVAIRALIESLRLGLAVLVGYGCALALESTCPAPTPENSSPGCEGLSFVYGAIIGFVGTIFLSLVAQWLWRHRQHRLTQPS
jgi:hypothetical protein